MHMTKTWKAIEGEKHVFFQSDARTAQKKLGLGVTHCQLDGRCQVVRI